MPGHLLLVYDFVLPDEGLATEFWEGGNVVSLLTLWFLALFVSHGISFYQNFIGRTEFDSPDVDNEVLVQASSTYIRIGDFANVMIEKTDHFDLYGVVID